MAVRKKRPAALPLLIRFERDFSACGGNPERILRLQLRERRMRRQNGSTNNEKGARLKIFRKTSASAIPRKKFQMKIEPNTQP